MQTELQYPRWLETLCIFKQWLSFLSFLDHALVVFHSVIVICKKPKFWKSNTEAYIIFGRFWVGILKYQISLGVRKNSFSMIFLNSDLLRWNTNARVRIKSLFLMAMRLLAYASFLLLVVSVTTCQQRAWTRISNNVCWAHTLFPTASGQPSTPKLELQHLTLISFKGVSSFIWKYLHILVVKR